MMDFCMIFDLRTKTGNRKISTLLSQLSLPALFGEAVKFANKEKQKREGRPIERQTKGTGGGQRTDILPRGSCGRQQEPHPQATLKCWTEQKNKRSLEHFMSPQFPSNRKVVCGQRNNHSAKWHKERTSLPRRKYTLPLQSDARVSLTFLRLGTKMSECLIFPVLKKTQANLSAFVLSEGFGGGD